MPRVAVPPTALVLVAGLADVAGWHSLAFYALVAAVPAAAVAALVALDRALRPDEPWPLHRAWVQAAVLVLVLVSAAVRAPFHEQGAVPRLAVSALVGSIVVLLAHAAAVRLAPVLRRWRLLALTARRSFGRT